MKTWCLLVLPCIATVLTTISIAGAGEEQPYPKKEVNRNDVQVLKVDKEFYLSEVRWPQKVKGSNRVRAWEYLTEINGEVIGLAETLEMADGYYVFYRQGNIKYTYDTATRSIVDLRNEDEKQRLVNLVESRWELVDLASVDNMITDKLHLLFRRRADYKLFSPISQEEVAIESEKLKIERLKDDVDSRSEFLSALTRHFNSDARGKSDKAKSHQNLLGGVGEYGKSYLVCKTPKEIDESGLMDPNNPSCQITYDVHLVEDDDSADQQAMEFEINTREEKGWRFLGAARLNHVISDDQIVLVFGRRDEAPASIDSKSGKKLPAGNSG